jgi:hypothetical protein
MDELTATKLYTALSLRAKGYRDYAIDFRERAADANSAEARDMYLRLAQGHEALADRAAHLVEDRSSR